MEQLALELEEEMQALEVLHSDILALQVLVNTRTQNIEGIRNRLKAAKEVTHA